MKRVIPILVIVITLILASSNVSFAATTKSSMPASPGPCYLQPNDQHCDGQYPGDQGCPPRAQPVARTPIYDGSVEIAYVELEYSDQCSTNWSIIEYRNCQFTAYELYASIQRQDGAFYSTTKFGSCNVGSKMVYAPVQSAQACAVAWPTSTRHLAACTPFI